MQPERAELYQQLRDFGFDSTRFAQLSDEDLEGVVKVLSSISAKYPTVEFVERRLQH